jgi:hypothetical protein
MSHSVVGELRRCYVVLDVLIARTDPLVTAYRTSRATSACFEQLTL